MKVIQSKRKIKSMEGTIQIETKETYLTAIISMYLCLLLNKI